MSRRRFIWFVLAAFVVGFNLASALWLPKLNRMEAAAQDAQRLTAAALGELKAVKESSVRVDWQRGVWTNAWTNVTILNWEGER